MSKLVFKTFIITSVLLSSQAFANNIVTNKTYPAKAGCMSCHESGMAESDNTSAETKQYDKKN